MTLVRPDALYLVTGGAGFVGSHLVETLLAGGARVRVIDDFSTGTRENLEPWRDRIELIEGSIVDPELCVRATGGVSYVLHQAALPSVPRSIRDPLGTHAADATGTLNLLVAARASGVQRFVYAGSSSAYGNTPVLPKHEDMPGDPLSPYAVSKYTGELYCRVFAGVMGLETVVLRYFNIFGPRQDPHSEYSAVIPLFITLALDGRSPTIHGDGGQTRDFTYIENAVQANLLACTRATDDVAGEVFNVGGGQRISIAELWREVQRATGAAVDAVHGPTRAGDVRDSLADLTKSRERLGYEPTVGLREGLRRTCDWFRG
ncbi:MAG: SDR family oxidoreductase [Gemmatimonadota bacterium]